MYWAIAHTPHTNDNFCQSWGLYQCMYINGGPCMHVCLCMGDDGPVYVCTVNFTPRFLIICKASCLPWRYCLYIARACYIRRT